MSICRCCGEEKSLAKAHIIPEAFYRDIRGAAGDLHQYSIDHPGRRKRRPIGLYDKSILCSDCDNLLSTADQYGAQTLLQREHEIVARTEHGRTDYCLPGVDSERFRRFLVAVLWRASVTELPMFAQVKLRRAETLAKSIAFGKIAPRDKDFPFFIAKFHPGPACGVMANPSRYVVGRTIYVRLFLPGYAVYVKTCSRPLPEQLRRVQYTGVGKLYMLGKDFRSIPEFEDFQSLAIAG